MPVSGGAITLPGFVDLQVNGFLGVNFSDRSLTQEAAEGACRTILARGTAAFLPTIITSPLEVYRKNLPLLAEIAASREFRHRVLGVHLEGPFISREPGAVGAHDPCLVQAPVSSLLGDLLDLGGGWVKLLTVAADVPGIEPLIEAAADRGVTVSIGHSMYNAGDLARARQAGARVLTHLGNGLPNLLPRHENPIWAGLANDDYTAMIIADGHHLPAAVLKAMIRAKGPERITVVSDASPIAGMPPGEYDVLGNHAILEPSGRLFNPEKQCLVGSAATMFDCMRYLASLDLLTPDELVLVGYRGPLSLIGLDPSDIRPPRDSAVCYHDGTFLLSKL
jgi:N-acetylglucosamine-6-phosphate deacetylase